MEVTPLCLYFSNCFTLHKQYSSMYAFIYIYMHIKAYNILYIMLERFWNGLMRNEQKVGWSGYPLDCYDYYSTCSAKILQITKVNLEKCEDENAVQTSRSELSAASLAS